MEKKTNKSSCDIRTTTVSPIDLFQLMLVYLKLAQVGTVASWSWFWVLTPVWLTLLIGIIKGVKQGMSERRQNRSELTKIKDKL